MKNVLRNIRIHFQFWVLYITFFSILISIEGSFSFSFYWVHFWFDLPAVCLFAYPLAYWIYPNFKKGHRLKWLTCIVVISLLASMAKLLTTYELFYNIYLPNELAPKNYFTLSLIGRNLFWIGLPSALLVLMRFYSSWLQLQKERTDLIKSRLEAELHLLKSQLNPHFLFNVLNNLYSLAITKSEKTPQSIARLSKLFEFMLYQSRKPLVLLKDEIELIQTYSELQEMKYGKRLKFSIDYDQHVLNVKVAPLLLFPFVENCFKHGCSNDPNAPYVNITIEPLMEGVRCVIVNSKPQNIVVDKGRKNGIGIENTRKRLNILYTDSHQIHVSETKDNFKVDLTLKGEPRTEKYMATHPDMVSFV